MYAYIPCRQRYNKPDRLQDRMNYSHHVRYKGRVETLDAKYNLIFR